MSTGRATIVGPLVLPDGTVAKSASYEVRPVGPTGALLRGPDGAIVGAGKGWTDEDGQFRHEVMLNDLVDEASGVGPPGTRWIFESRNFAWPFRVDRDDDGLEIPVGDGLHRCPDGAATPAFHALAVSRSLPDPSTASPGDVLGIDPAGELAWITPI